MELFLQILKIAGSAAFMVFFFGMCIFIHELGHFLAARWCGLHIVAFSIGFKKVWSKKINGVEYRIGCIPVGGYVDLPQIDSSDDKVVDENGNELPPVAPWKRMVTAFAGPLFNILFALVLGCVIWIAGLPQGTPKAESFRVTSIQIESPEFQAGLRPGDEIIEFNGEKFSFTWSDFAREVMLNVGDVDLTVRKTDGSTGHVIYRPEVNRQVMPNAKVAMPFFTVDVPVEVTPLEGSPAEKAGIRTGDRIETLNGKKIYWQDMLNAIRFSDGKAVTLGIRRGETVQEVTVIPEHDGESYTFAALFSPNEDMLVEHIYPGTTDLTGLKVNDKILKVDGQETADLSAFYGAVLNKKDTPFVLTVQRGKEILDLTVKLSRSCKIGVMLQGISHPDPVRQLWNVLELTGRSLKSVSAGVRRKLGSTSAGHTTLGPQHFSGPLGIGQTLYQSVYKGSLIIGLNLVVMISFSLGLFNLLPIPVLDGGHIMLSLLEMITRRKLSAKILQPIMYFFIFVLIGFMLYVTFFDIKRLIPEEPEEPGTIMTEYNMQRIGSGAEK